MGFEPPNLFRHAVQTTPVQTVAFLQDAMTPRPRREQSLDITSNYYDSISGLIKLPATSYCNIPRAG